MHNKLSIFLGLLALSVTCRGGTLNSTGELADLKTVVGNAATNDTVIMGNGTHDWAGGALTIAKNIQLIGGGMDSTVITNGQITITAKKDSAPLSGQPHFRLSGFTMTRGALKPAISVTGTAQLYFNGGTSKYEGGVRLDHIKWNGTIGTHTLHVGFGGYITGVMDHCMIDDPLTTAAGETIIVARSSDPDGNGASASYDWSVPYDYGGFRTFFIEDCIFKRYYAVEDSGTAVGGTPGASGGVEVGRHNTSYGTLCNGHGTETGARVDVGGRSRRASEAYNNFFYFRHAQAGITGGYASVYIGSRGGGLVFFNNRFDGGIGQEYSLFVYRNGNNMGTFGGANGYSPYDDNDRGTTGPLGPNTGVTDGLGNLSYTGNGGGTFTVPESKRGFVYARGTHGSATGGTSTTVVLNDLPSAGIATNAWKGADGSPYVIINTKTSDNWKTIGCPPPFATILGSTASGSGTQLTIGKPSQCTGTFVLADGQSWEIRHVLVTSDTVGAGAGELVTGLPLSLPTGAGLHQSADGIWAFPGTNLSKSETGSSYAPMVPNVTAQAGPYVISRRNVHDAVMTTALGGPVNYPTLTNGTSHAPSNIGIGADWNDPTGTFPATVDGSGNYVITAPQAYGFQYPHPLVAGGGAAPSPQITSAPTATFSTGTAVNCSTNTNCLTVTTSNFSGSPTFSASVTSVPGGATPATLPTNVTFPNSGVLSGTAASAISGDYGLTITATYAPASETATQAFILKITSPNAAPTVSITANGATFLAPATITITASPLDLDGTIAKVDFYQGGSNLIGTVTSSPWVFSWGNVAVGNYALTAKATDNASAVSAASNTVNVSVITVAAPTPPTNIIVTP